LQQGAKLVQRVEDIVVELDLPCSKSPKTNNVAPREDNLDVEPDALTLLSYLEPYPSAREILLVKSGFSPARVSELLLLLELDGLIEMLPGDKLRKISR
jgi:DNA processing protein